jgi:hypothetical protein
VKYMMLIYTPDADGSDWSPEEQQAELARWFAYSDEMAKAGVMLAGDALQPTSTATCVRERDGKDLVTDGPFAETKEVLGGYYLMDVPSLDEAIDWARKCPASSYGTLELRPLMEFDMPDRSASS